MDTRSFPSEADSPTLADVQAVVAIPEVARWISERTRDLAGELGMSPRLLVASLAYSVGLGFRNSGKHSAIGADGPWRTPFYPAVHFLCERLFADTPAGGEKMYQRAESVLANGVNLGIYAGGGGEKRVVKCLTRVSG